MADDTLALTERDLHQWDLLAMFRRHVVDPAALEQIFGELSGQAHGPLAAKRPSPGNHGLPATVRSSPRCRA